MNKLVGFVEDGGCMWFFVGSVEDGGCLWFMSSRWWSVVAMGLREECGGEGEESGGGGGGVERRDWRWWVAVGREDRGG